MSIILDALRRGRGKQTTETASSPAQTDAVLQTLGYSRIEQVSKLKRIMRIAVALILGVVVGILLWMAVDWVIRASRQPDRARESPTAPTEQPRAAPDSTLTRAWLTAGGRGAATPEDIRSAQRAISIDPQDVRARNELGVAYLAQGRFDEAAVQFHAAQASDPENVASMVNLSAVEKESGRREEARRWAIRALQIDGRNPEAHYNLGLLEDQAGNTEQARTHYLAFVQLGAAAYPSLATEVRRRIDTLSAK